MLHTDPSLAALRRPLKPLLASALAGEPWRVALRDPDAVAPDVIAACVVSYLSRRDPCWHRLSDDALPVRMVELVTVDRREHVSGEWPFLDALEGLLPLLRSRPIAPLLAPYRDAWTPAHEGDDPPAPVPRRETRVLDSGT